MAMRECVSCAGREADGAVFPDTLTWRKRRRCTACIAEIELAPRPLPTSLITRASYRAKLRHRATLLQADLVDLVVPTP